MRCPSLSQVWLINLANPGHAAVFDQKIAVLSSPWEGSIILPFLSSTHIAATSQEQVKKSHSAPRLRL